MSGDIHADGWLSGWFDAYASFALYSQKLDSPKKRRGVARFVVNVVGDADLAKFIINRLGCGYLVCNKGKPRYVVVSKLSEQIEKVIPFFGRVQLRVQADQFKQWRRGVEFLARRPQKTPEWGTGWNRNPWTKEEFSDFVIIACGMTPPPM